MKIEITLCEDMSKNGYLLITTTDKSEMVRITVGDNEGNTQCLVNINELMFALQKLLT